MDTVNFIYPRPSLPACQAHLHQACLRRYMPIHTVFQSLYNSSRARQLYMPINTPFSVSAVFHTYEAPRSLYYKIFITFLLPIILKSVKHAICMPAFFNLPLHFISNTLISFVLIAATIPLLVHHSP